MSKPRPTYGGQAVLEGVMIRGQRNVSVAVRAPSDEILVKTTAIDGLFTGKLRTLPIIRGVLALIETLLIKGASTNHQETKYGHNALHLLSRIGGLEQSNI